MARPIGLQVLQHLSQSAEIQVCLLFRTWELGRTSEAVIKWSFGLLQTLLLLMTCSHQYTWVVV